VNIYSKKDLNSLPGLLDLTDDQYFQISLEDDEDLDGAETYFDGFAEVYDCIISVIGPNKNGRRAELESYTGTITHDVYAFFVNGE